MSLGTLVKNVSEFEDYNCTVGYVTIRKYSSAMFKDKETYYK